MTTEPMAITSGTASTTFRITDSAKRLINPNDALHVKNGTTTVAYSDISSIDFLNGIITFASARADGSVTSISFSGSYLPITTTSDVVLETKSFKLSQSRDLLDTTVLTGTTDFTRKRLAALKDFSLDVESIALDADLAWLATTFFNGDHVVPEVYFGDVAAPRFRAFCKIGSMDKEEDVEGLGTINVSFQAAAVLNSDSGQVADYKLLAFPG